MTGKLVSALGEEGINQLHGIELLAALEGAPHLVHAQTDLEHLVAGCRQPWRLVQALQVLAPHLDPNDWERISSTDWMLPKEPKLHSIPPAAQLLLYRIGAWRAAFAYVGSPVSDSIAVWDAAPECIQRDTVMQQIVAFKMPTLFQALVERDPDCGWDTLAQGLFVQHQGFPSLDWLRRADDALLRLLLVYHPDNTNVNAMEPWLLEFSNSQLTIVRDQHPALFFQGLILDRERREDPLATAWFPIMWDALMDRVYRTPQYADVVLNARTLADEGEHFRQAIAMFAPKALDTFPVSQSLHSNALQAWWHWLESQANAKHTGAVFDLPDLDAGPDF